MKRLVPYILIIIAFFLLASLWGFFISIKAPRIISQVTPADFNLDFEEVTFKTSDNLNLSGWFISREKGEQAKTIILLHGYPADKGDILPLMRFLNDEYNLFLFDFRYFGESEGKYSTAGAKEIRDLEAAIKYLKSRGIDEVGVWGFSMGAAVALMTAETAPEIKAVVADSPYPNLSLMTYELHRIPLLRYPLGYLTGLWGRIFFGIDIKKVSPELAAKNLSIPTLIFQSKEYPDIPFENAKETPENYEERILEFFMKVF